VDSRRPARSPRPQGASAAEQAEEAKKTQERVEKQIDDAQQAAMDARARAESASE
jgi:hypothetical protein